MQRRVSGGSFTGVAVLENATLYLDTGLATGTGYFYQVQAANLGVAYSASPASGNKLVSLLRPVSRFQNGWPP